MGAKKREYGEAIKGGLESGRIGVWTSQRVNKEVSRTYTVSSCIYTTELHTPLYSCIKCTLIQEL